ncbi:MAG: hypothetical protein HYS40_03090, partial [Gemmatimonadetes bacterium]|nr:hypothetical protein [Gemmatimonadota bacterium]
LRIALKDSLAVADCGLRIGTRRIQSAIAVVALLAACQPQSRRLLLLDLALSDPAALEATAEPWDAAGYTVEYRRFYPHVTRQDLDRYHVVMLLGGREPEAPSDALDLGDLALLTEWVPRGGVLIFGYTGDGEGYGDRWVMNRWLASVGTGITIGDYVLRDTLRAGVQPARGGALHGAGFEPFPAGRQHVLLTRDESQALARASRTAFVRLPGQPPAARPRAAVVAADRVGNGLVVIGSRHTLGALGPEYRAPTALPPDAGALARTRRFLVALARWTRRPAEWALLPPARLPVQLSLLAAPRPLAVRPPPFAPPPGVTTAQLPGPAAPDTAGSPPGTPIWIRQQGMRVVWSRDRVAPGPALDSLVTFLETGAFNALWSSADLAADSLADAVRPWRAGRGGPRILVDRLQQTSVLWIPGLDLRRFRPPANALERGIAGDSLPAWCTLDARFWDEELTPAYLVLARLAARRPDVTAGVALDLELPGSGGYGMGFGFCDGSYLAALRELQRDSAWTNRFAALPPAARYGALLVSGDLEAYYGALEREVAARAAAIRAAVRRVRPDVLFAFHSASPPTDWFSLGLLRGFSGTDAPLLLWTREPRARHLLARYRARGISVVHAVGVRPAAFMRRDWSRLRRIAFGDNDGFWIAAEDAGAPLPADSLARLIRRLAKER